MTNDFASSIIATPVGPLYVRVVAGHLRQLSFCAKPRIPAFADIETDAVLTAVRSQLDEYFRGRRRAFDLPLDLTGPQFYVRVWHALREIPYGETISYGGLAQRLNLVGAARAVGAANGANPIVIVVPCHRVIGADGSLVGFGGGLQRKQALLDLERGRVPLAISASDFAQE